MDKSRQTFFYFYAPAPTGDDMPPHVNTDTSRQAAENVKPRVGRQRWIVWCAIEKRGRNGLTDYEIHRVTGIPENSVRPRRGELIKMGYVVEHPKKLRRLTGRGGNAIVWIAKCYEE